MEGRVHFGCEDMDAYAMPSWYGLEGLELKVSMESEPRYYGSNWQFTEKGLPSQLKLRIHDVARYLLHQAYFRIRVICIKNVF